jgi:hypothetical protein
MARKLFGINDQAIKYATCKKCCKLYAIKDLPTDEPYHCTYQDFLNHPMANLRSPCNAIITKQVAINQYRPSLIFPIANIRHQLQLRLLAETFLITAETYTENAETILNHIKNPAETLLKC